MAATKRRASKRDALSPLRELETVAERLSIPVRYEKGEMRGGLCTVRGRLQIIINDELSDEEKAEVLASGLAQTDVDAVYVSPRVRHLLEQARQEAPEGNSQK